MTQTIFFALMAILFVTSLASPWVGLIASHFISILNPQAIWFWLFVDLRPVMFVTVPLMAGLTYKLMTSKESLSGLRNEATYWILILAAACIISRIFGPFAASFGTQTVQDSNFLLGVQLKIIITFALTVILIKRPVQIKATASVVIISALYLVFWSNREYFSGKFAGRLPGPMAPDGGGTYADENMFAAFFVAAMPFLWYYGGLSQRTYVRIFLWASIPFLWHSIFLTGSRGGLLGLLAGTGVILLRSKKPFLYSILFIPLLLGAFFWQGGEAMLNRASSITEYQEDRSASRRLDAWIVAVKMMQTYPLTGVGPGSFIRAFPDFDQDTPIQAHNTFFQMAGEYGVIGLISITCLVLSGFRLGFHSARLLSNGDNSGHFNEIYIANESVIAALSGLFVCSLFLTLQLFEMLYLLLAMAVCINNYLMSQHLKLK